MRCRVNISIRLKEILIVYDHIEKLVINKTNALGIFIYIYISFYISDRITYSNIL